MIAMDIHSFQAIAFDFDGTLADNIAAHHEARMRAFADHGLGHITREQHERGPEYGTKSYEIIGGILHEAGVLDTSKPYMNTTLIDEIIASRNTYFKELAVRGFNEHPGAVDLILALLAAGFGNRMGIVTVSPYEGHVEPFLRRYRLLEVIPRQFVVDESVLLAHNLQHKPAPDAYTFAMQLLHVTEPARLLVIEDTTHGVEAAKLAGATVIALANVTTPREMFEAAAYRPDVIIDTFAEARTLLGV
jgi:beta-phosphoglucomutase